VRLVRYGGALRAVARLVSHGNGGFFGVFGEKTALARWMHRNKAGTKTVCPFVVFLLQFVS
jgi:hypothetical protein